MKTKKYKNYPETHFYGNISYEKNIRCGMIEGDIGIQIASDGRIWICINGEAIIRFKPKVELKP